MNPLEGTQELLVVGAGAAGLWAAARAAELGLRVLLLEKTPRTGTKVLASGGTRCNLTTSLPPEEAARLFGARGERFLRGAFRALSPRDVRARFAELGVPTVEAPLDKVFPVSQRARDVRDALESWARQAGVTILLRSNVRGVEFREGRWRVHVEGGQPLAARKLFLCPGGASYPLTGTTGDGYRWLEALELPIEEPIPALVPLVTSEPWVGALAGIHLQNVQVKLKDAAGAVLASRERPIVFSQRGISGPGAMDLSEPVAREEARARREGRAPRAHVLLLDLAPAREREELRSLLVEAAARPGAPVLAAWLAAELSLPRRIAQRALLQAGAGERSRANELARSARHGLVEALKGLAVPVEGTLGFEKAEVTSGGLALPALDPATLRVKGRERLWVFGELLDLAGPIGGLNFQAAFSTAELAARNAARP